MQAQLRHTQLNLLCHAWVRWHLGRVTTYSSLSLTHSLTHALSIVVAAAAELSEYLFAILLLIAVLSGNCAAAASCGTHRPEFQAKGGLPIAFRG